MAKADLATFDYAAGQWPTAALLGQEAVAALREIVKDDHPWVLAVRINLTRTATKSRQTTDAEEQLDRVHEDIEIEIPLT